MDKRKNKILIGCLALLLVMAVGYALFSENITINGTANAQGDFDITTTCTKGWDSRLGSLEDLGLPNEGGYENDSCIVNNNEVTINANFLYPSATRYFIVKITNTGTIEALMSLDDLYNYTGKVCADGATTTSNHNGQIEEDDECFEPNSQIGTLIGNILEFEVVPFAFENSDNVIITDETGIEEFIDENNNVKLKPNQSVYILHYLGLTSDADGSGDFLFTSNLSYKLNWKQVQAQ